MDWTVASSQGALGFLNFAEDWDYNLLFLPNNDTGLTGNNNRIPNEMQRYIEVEFDSRELADRFGTQWWQDFARLAMEGAQKGGDFTEVETLMHAGSGFPTGVVYGVFGLDCEHGCRSEFHPAYAVAVQVDDTKDMNTWAIFARNWGDEGFCSHLDHYLDSYGQPMQLLLPYSSKNPPSRVVVQQAASSAKASEKASSSGQSEWCPTFSFSKNEGEMIEIPLPPPSEYGLTEVVVQITWPDDASPIPSKNIDAPTILHQFQQQRNETRKGPSAEESAEEHIGRLYHSFQGKDLAEEQFRPTILDPYLSTHRLTAELKPLTRNNALSCSVPDTKTLAEQKPIKTTSAEAKRVPLPVDAQKVIWDKATLTRICSAYGHSGRKLPAGEPSDTAQKLDKICKDKRLNQ
jgi:hypothetical protein